MAASPSFSHMLPNYFKDPQAYQPDRFAAPREEDKAKPFTYLGFGGGRHGCLGQNFAYLQVRGSGYVLAGAAVVHKVLVLVPWGWCWGWCHGGACTSVRDARPPACSTAVCNTHSVISTWCYCSCSGANLPACCPTCRSRPSGACCCATSTLRW